MSQRPLVGYDHQEEEDEAGSDVDQLDIDDHDDYFDTEDQKQVSQLELKDSDPKASSTSREESRYGDSNQGGFRAGAGLVSYGGEGESEDEGSSPEADNIVLVQRQAEAIISQNDGLSSVDSLSPNSVGSPYNDVPDSKKEDGMMMAVQLPPEPEGRCSRKLQDKIARMLEKKERGKLSLNEHVQRKKDFRNPSIYEKLVLFCEINETGSNYPKKYFDPKGWGAESYYDALAKAQKEAHEKKEKEKQKRTQVDFVTATKKAPPSVVSSSTQAVDDKQKKSKWDNPTDPGKVAGQTSGAPKQPLTTDIPAKKPKLSV